ncbi:LysE family translocator [Colwelliaceae bacterium BS250]
MEFFYASLLFALSATITPGPNNIMIMTSGLNYGVKKSLPHLFGICLGFPAMVIIVGLGFGIVFETYPVLHQLIKIAGILYLLYLAWMIASSKPSDLKSGDTESKPFSFIQAVLFQWVNPKAWVMVTGAVAAYTSTQGNVFIQVFAIAMAFFIVAFPCVGSWLYFGVGMRQVLQKPNYQRAFNILMALLLVLSITPVIVELFNHYI